MRCAPLRVRLSCGLQLDGELTLHTVKGQTDHRIQVRVQTMIHHCCGRCWNEGERALCSLAGQIVVWPTAGLQAFAANHQGPNRQLKCRFGQFGWFLVAMTRKKTACRWQLGGVSERSMHLTHLEVYKFAATLRAVPAKQERCIDTNACDSNITSVLALVH